MQGCEFRCFSSRIVGISRFGLKNGTNQKGFHLARISAHSVNPAQVLTGTFWFCSGRSILAK